VAETALGTIGLSVCYDLIFGDYMQRLVGLGAELIINSTNWIADACQREVRPSRGSQRGARLRTWRSAPWQTGSGTRSASTASGTPASPAPSGKLLASIAMGAGIAVANLGLPQEDLERWRSIATYRQDRRPDVYRWQARTGAGQFRRQIGRHPEARVNTISWQGDGLS
jgi:5-aminopentanamidase